MKHKEGCVPAGLKLTAILILIVAIAVIMFGCSTQKTGCWKGYEPKFRYDKKFNK